MTQDREATLLTLIKNLFVNRDDITVARWETDDKSGYSPLCSNKKTAACRIGTKPKSPCRDCPNRAHVPLSDETLAAHLAGNMTIAVSAPALDGTTKWACIDVDGEQSLAAAPRLLSAADELGLRLVLERSRSGQGLHAWMSFAKVSRSFPVASHSGRPSPEPPCAANCSRTRAISVFSTRSPLIVKAIA